MTVVIETKGGIGNVLYQYALGFALSSKSKDVYFYNAHAKGDSFFSVATDWGLSLPYANDEVVESLRPKNKFIRIAKRKLGFSKEYFEKKRNTYDYNVFNLDDAYISGYWHHRKYFQCVKSELIIHLRDIVQRTVNVSDNDRLPCVMHVRRGDFLKHSHIGFVGLDYYYNAFERLASSGYTGQVFVVSDDPDWVVENLQSPSHEVVVLKNGNQFEDFYKLMLADRLVMANSSFSWWAAFLNLKAGLILSPRRWLAVQNDRDDWWCEEWEVL